MGVTRSGVYVSMTVLGAELYLFGPWHVFFLGLIQISGFTFAERWKLFRLRLGEAKSGGEPFLFFPLRRLCFISQGTDCAAIEKRKLLPHHISALLDETHAQGGFHPHHATINTDPLDTTLSHYQITARSKTQGWSLCPTSTQASPQHAAGEPQLDVGRGRRGSAQHLPDRPRVLGRTRAPGSSAAGRYAARLACSASHFGFGTGRPRSQLSQKVVAWSGSSASC